MLRVKNLYDLFKMTVRIWLRADDIYSFNNIYAPTPFDCIKQHFDDCSCETGVLNKTEKSRNKIAAPKGYDSRGKDLGV